MAKFRLQPCHVRDDKFAPLKGKDPVDWDWKTLKEHLAPSGDRNALMNLRMLQVGAFVGLTKADKSNKNFMLLNQDRSARLDWILKRDPTFDTRVVEVYRVDAVQWDSNVVEFGTPEPAPWDR